MGVSGEPGYVNIRCIEPWGTRVKGEVNGRERQLGSMVFGGPLQ